MKRILLVVVVIAVFIIVLSVSLLSQSPAMKATYSRNPLVAEMIQKVDERNVYSTVYDLQNFTTRSYGSEGNHQAANYLYNKLSNISGLEVEYQGGDLRNVIATLQGKDTSSEIYMFGAHYDCQSDNQSYAPGATDNGGGVAIVMELARVMSQHEFNHTIKFAFWNAEEGGANIGGSQAYVRDAVANHLNLALYFNFDSSCYDPNHRLILDIMYNDQSSWISDMITQHNSLYDIGFNLTYKVFNTHGSDHRSFWSAGYTAIMTHEETHGPAHSTNDTVDQVSTEYAKKNAQLGMSVIAKLAEPV